MTESPQSVRKVLSGLAATGDLRVVADEVDPLYEIGAFLLEADGGPALLFEKVKGHDISVFGNLLSSRQAIARSLGAEVEALHAVLSAAPDRAVVPRRVAIGPCQEVVIDRPDLDSLPVPRFFEGETGRYITAGVIVTKGVDGDKNASFARLKLLDGRRAFVGIAPEHHLAVLARQAAERGHNLEVAVTIGNHPAVLLAGAYYLELGKDELEVAGALLGSPLDVVCCKSVDLDVPAECEIVLEGTLDAAETVEEGAVSEYSGLYEDYGRGPVVTVRRITMRSGALFQTILPGYAAEHVLIGAVAIAAVLERRLRRDFPFVSEVTVTPGGCGRLHAVVAVSEHEDSQIGELAKAALGAVRLVKQVVVVDDDVDAHDPLEVERAMATCMKADRDLTILPGMGSSRSDPLARDGTVAKLGINATRRAGDRGDWRRALPPGEARERARSVLCGRASDPLQSRRLDPLDAANPVE